MNSLLFNDQTYHSFSRVIIALDFQKANTALDFVKQLDPALCALKVGNELFTSAGPTFIEQLIAQGFRVFLDFKLIPTLKFGAKTMGMALAAFLIITCF